MLNSRYKLVLVRAPGLLDPKVSKPGWAFARHLPRCGVWETVLGEAIPEHLIVEIKEAV